MAARSQRFSVHEKKVKPSGSALPGHSYLSPAPHALPHADGFSSGAPAPHALPHADGFSSGAPAPHALPHADGFSSGALSPHALPHADDTFLSSFHSAMFDNAIVFPS